MVTADGTTVEDVLGKLQKSIGQIPQGLANQISYATAYHRAISDVGVLIDYDRFIDPAWTERLVIGATDRLVQVLDAARSGRPDDVPAPWRLVFAAPAGSAGRNLVMGLGVQLNFELPQAVLAVAGVNDFSHPDYLTVHRWDLERVDAIMAPRIADQFAHDSRLRKRVLAPVYQLAVRLMLRDARHHLWRNVLQLRAARVQGEGAFRRRLAELEELTAARIQKMRTSGLAAVRYTVLGFGLVLPPSGGPDAARRPGQRVHSAVLPRQRRASTLDRRDAPTSG